MCCFNHRDKRFSCVWEKICNNRSLKRHHLSCCAVSLKLKSILLLHTSVGSGCAYLSKPVQTSKRRELWMELLNFCPSGNPATPPARSRTIKDLYWSGVFFCVECALWRYLEWNISPKRFACSLFRATERAAAAILVWPACARKLRKTCQSSPGIWSGLWRFRRS